METTIANIITNPKKLNAKIDTVCKGVKAQYANIQIILASAIWRGFAHGDNDYADRIVRQLPERLKGTIKTYLTEVGPFSWNADNQKMGTKKGHKASIELANEKCADLPNWETFKKASESKPLKALNLFESLAKRIDAALKDNNVDAEQIAQANALLSYMDNIKAGLTKEKMLADAQIAMLAKHEADAKIERDANIQTQTVIAEASKQKQAA